MIISHDLFSTGIIYPQKNEGSEFNGQQDEIVSAEGAGEEIIDDDLRQEKEHISNRKKSSIEADAISDDINLANQFQPSSIGISFHCEDGDKLDFSIYFAEYEEVNLSVQPSNTIDNSGDANLENSENRDIRIEDQQNVRPQIKYKRIETDWDEKRDIDIEELSSIEEFFIPRNNRELNDLKLKIRKRKIRFLGANGLVS